MLTLGGEEAGRVVSRLMWKMLGRPSGARVMSQYSADPEREKEPSRRQPMAEGVLECTLMGPEGNVCAAA
jgi:hypothetical protein